MAVGDGVVTKSSYTSGNGKYVKIRHNSTYETQYLHMSKRAVKEGQRVKKMRSRYGKTGLATGPHVCFRFWKTETNRPFARVSLPTIDAAAGIICREVTDWKP